MRPNVNINLTNGNLNLQGPSADGIAVLLVASPVAPVAGYGVPFLVKSPKEASTAFVQAGNEAVVAAINLGFYAEAPEGSPLYILAMARATPLATLASAANAEKALMLAGGTARLVALVKFPDTGTYVPTITNGFDVDVYNSVVAMQTLAASWQLQNKGFRFMVEGYAFVDAASAKDYSAQVYRNGEIIVFNIDNATSTATLLALGRAARVQSQENIGKVKTGSLNIADTSVVKIGSVSADLVPSADLETLWSKRFVTVEKNAIASGYVFNDDNMLTAVTDDYNNLRYGRVIDNAQRIAFTAYYEELKNDVDVDDNGRISKVAEKALEAKVETAIDLGMRAQLSKKQDGSAQVICLVNPDATQYAALYSKNNITPNFNLIETGTIYLFLMVMPKGCLKYIDVYLGLEATAQ